jgi:hypothetical protein
MSAMSVEDEGGLLGVLLVAGEGIRKGAVAGHVVDELLSDPGVPRADEVVNAAVRFL